MAVVQVLPPGSARDSAGASGAFAGRPGSSPTRTSPAHETPQVMRPARGTTNARKSRRCVMDMPPRDVLGDSIRPDYLDVSAGLVVPPRCGHTGRSDRGQASARI